MSAIELIAAERQRQIEVEGWSPEHDDQHRRGELARAAACYAVGSNELRDGHNGVMPWESRWWKPSPDNRVRDLVKAGALIVAEIERLQRQTT
jgi:hypothetical protein